jgi:pentatricopeptide repeat protein
VSSLARRRSKQMKSGTERKIAEYVAKLETLNGPEDKRVKKRVLAALGKLKKELLGLDSLPSNSTSDGERGNSSVENENVAAGKADDVVLSRKQLKVKLKFLNKELADFAQKKQLKLAVKRFSWGVRKGMEPDKHTYANLINCYVRCGDLDGALKQFVEMKAAKLAPNIVVYTILLKGYCDKGDLSGAQSVLFTEMPTCKLSPGIRTVSTFIRGCTKIGAVNSALRAYDLLKDLSSRPLDAQSVCSKSTKASELSDKKRKRSTETEEDDEADVSVDASLELTDAAEGEFGSIDENGGQATVSESVVALLCQALQVKDASLLALEAVSSSGSSKGEYYKMNTLFQHPITVISRSNDMTLGGIKTNDTSDFASTYVNLSKASLFLGMIIDAEKWLGCAVAALEGSKSSQLRKSMQKNREDQNQIGTDGSGDKGGKRSRSIDLFLRHKRAEIESEVEVISDCLSVIRSTVSKQTMMAHHSPAVASRVGLFQALSRVLHFGFNGRGDFDRKADTEGTKSKKKLKTDSTSEVGLTTHLILALRDKFGLDRIQHDVITAPSDLTSSTALLKSMKNGVVLKMLRLISEDTGFIDFTELFKAVEREGKEDSNTEVNRVNLSTLPVNIEICSGSGEWVVAHAASDLYYTPPRADKRRQSAEGDSTLKPKALWLALELRCDRVYHTICRSVMENIVRHSQHMRQSRSDSSSTDTPATGPSPVSFGGLPNLAVIGGDASNILPNHIAPGSIANVYINHPEPPERTGGVGDSEGKHLLTKSFFNEIHRILGANGTCTIVTDNLPYAKSLLDALAKAAVIDAKSPSVTSKSFISVKFDSSRTDKIVLEEQIVVSAESPSALDGITVKMEVQVASKSLRTAEGSSSGESSGDDSDSDSVGVSYVNDEDFVASEGKSDIIRHKKASSKVDPKASISMTKSSVGGSRLEGSHGKAIHLESSGGQALQLWRGDSAEVSINDDNTHVSSYFDRMWERGQKKRRWFMVLKKQF